MNAPDFSTTLLVDQAPKDVFEALTNVRGWWSQEIEGDTAKLGAEFKYHYEDVHNCTIKVIELVPNKKVVWHVLNNYFKFTKDKSEWTDTTISFDITQRNNQTALTFTHNGLVPEYECFDVCSNAWTNYIQKSLRDLITTGKGLPNAKGVPRTEHEKSLNAGR